MLEMSDKFFGALKGAKIIARDELRRRGLERGTVQNISCDVNIQED
jgi:hypothetical protein